jgi:hypothetical protein
LRPFDCLQARVEGAVDTLERVVLREGRGDDPVTDSCEIRAEEVVAVGDIGVPPPGRAGQWVGDPSRSADRGDSDRGASVGSQHY